MGDHLRFAGVTAALVMIIMILCDPHQRWIVPVVMAGPWALAHAALARAPR